MASIKAWSEGWRRKEEREGGGKREEEREEGKRKEKEGGKRKEREGGKEGGREGGGEGGKESEGGRTHVYDSVGRVERSPFVRSPETEPPFVRSPETERSLLRFFPTDFLALLLLNASAMNSASMSDPELVCSSSPLSRSLEAMGERGSGSLSESWKSDISTWGATASRCHRKFCR